MADGLDMDGDGRVDAGWDRLDMLTDYSEAVMVGWYLCGLDPVAERRVRDSGIFDEGELGAALTLSRAYLC